MIIYAADSFYFVWNGSNFFHTCSDAIVNEWSHVQSLCTVYVILFGWILFVLLFRLLYLRPYESWFSSFIIYRFIIDSIHCCYFIPFFSLRIGCHQHWNTPTNKEKKITPKYHYIIAFYLMEVGEWAATVCNTTIRYW